MTRTYYLLYTYSAHLNYYVLINMPFYATADTKLADVKLGQLGDWFTRRSYNPMAVFRATGRGKTYASFQTNASLTISYWNHLCAQSHSGALL